MIGQTSSTRWSAYSPEKIAAAYLLVYRNKRTRYSPDLPAPHPKQDDVIRSPAKRKVCVWGRRAGKTTLFSMIASQKFDRGGRVLYAAPTTEQTDRFWYACKHHFRDAIDQGRLYKSETRRIIEAPGADENAPRIKAKTAYDADNMRGDWGDLVLLDEYAEMHPNVDDVVLPMMLDTDGDLILGGTPKRRNHFYHKYVQAMQDMTGRWDYWHITSMDNPHLSETALSEIAQDLTDEGYRQEIMAEFLENQGAVFRNIGACLYSPNGDAHSGDHLVVIGVDWAKEHDFTAISVGCAECKRELELDRFNQIDYAFQRGRLRAISDRWGVTTILAESNAMGDPIIEQLQDDGLNVQGFQTTATSKPPLIENLALAIERQEWLFIDDPVATAELEAYERKVSPTTSRSTYSAPAGLHDDTVMARALMLRAGGHIPFRGI